MEKKQMKISLKTAIIIAIIVITLMLIIGVGIYIKQKNKKENNQTTLTENYNYTIEDSNKTKETEGDYEKLEINGEIYYHRLTQNEWNGEYHQDKYETNKSNNKAEVISYEDYAKYIDEINDSITSNKIEKYYNDEKSNYVILSYSNGHSHCEINLIDYKEEDGKISIYGDESINGVMASGSGFLIAIPTKLPVGTEVKYNECYSDEEISNIKNYGESKPSNEVHTDKPIIYLYPTYDMNVSVKLINKENIIHSYPKYQDGWNVLAKTNGTLKDVQTNRELYSLYYESNNSINFKVENEGFVVKGEDTSEFLEEKLSILGLSERETEEFIIYWLPKLEKNKYNYIRFATKDEIEANMPLKIDPKPDTIIRVLMTYKEIDNPINVKEQKLIPQTRKGFVAVEWGGSEIK